MPAMPVMGEKEGVMPKETVQLRDDMAVHVGWQRFPEGSASAAVQLATIAKPHSAEGVDDPLMGLYVDLNRDQINAVIRNLRRARDAAYGRDE
jgi:hypothetical protein